MLFSHFISDAVKATNVDANIDEIKTSVEIIVQGIDQLAVAVKDLVSRLFIESVLYLEPTLS